MCRIGEATRLETTAAFEANAARFVASEVLYDPHDRCHMTLVWIGEKP
jgi:hypothetical protein